jgi:dTDP-4-dehydrorhamnose 3,5-epimerase
VIFEELPLAGAYLVTLERIEDERGFNARAWCAREFEEAGLPTRIRQINVIRNARRGTLRGMHYQTPPMAETKLFRVTSGRIYDVIVDLRSESPTFGRWTSVELSAHEPQLLFVPERFGQGFQTLEDDTELTYQVSEFFSPEHGAGFRYDDAAFGIEWPLDVTIVSEKDAAWPPFEGPP